jgi:hypothetical protein
MGDRAEAFPFELGWSDRIAGSPQHPTLNMVLGVLLVANGCWGTCRDVDVLNGRLPSGTLLDAPPGAARLPTQEGAQLRASRVYGLCGFEESEQHLRLNIASIHPESVDQAAGRSA